MSSTLIFINHPSEIVPSLNSVMPSSQIIALNPMSRAALQRQGINALDTQAYLPTTSQAAIINKAAQLTIWLRTNFQYHDEHGLSIGYQDTLVWTMRLIIIHCLWAIEILQQANTIHTVTRLQSALSLKPSLSSVMQPNEHYFGELAQQFANIHGMEFSQLNPQRLPVTPLNFLVQVERYLGCTILRPLYAWLAKWQLRQLTGAASLVFGTQRYNQSQLAKQLAQKFPKSPRILLTEGGLGQWLVKPRPDIFTHTLPLSFIEASTQPNSDAAQNLEQSLQILTKKILQASDLFTYHKVSFAPIAVEYLQARLIPFIRHLHQRATALTVFFNTVRPAALFSAGNREDDILLGEICRQQEVPALLISHGSHTVPLTEPAQQEWLEHSTHLIRAPYPTIALQTPAAEEFLKVLPPPFSPHLLRTGPLLWGRPADKTKGASLRQKILAAHPQTQFILVHAGTTKFSQAARLFVYETPDEYIQSLRDLVQAVGPLPQAHLIIRFRPMPQLSVADLQQLVPFPAHVTLSVTETFEEVLGVADLLVSFSSTTIEEALQNKIPVLLYGAGGRYHHLPAVDLNDTSPVQASAIYAVAQLTALENGLRKIITLSKETSPEEMFAPYLFSESVLHPIAHWVSKNI